MQPVTYVAGTDFTLSSYDTGTNTATLRFLGANERGVSNTLWSGIYTVAVTVQPQSGLGQSLLSTHSYDIVFISGDANNDGDVDFSDILVVSQHYGQSGNWTNSFEVGDVNNDGVVNFTDLLYVNQYYGFDWIP